MNSHTCSTDSVIKFLETVDRVPECLSYMCRPSKYGEELQGINMVVVANWREQGRLDVNSVLECF
jgi:hypothetical protein